MRASLRFGILMALILGVDGVATSAENGNFPLFTTGRPTQREFVTETAGYGALSRDRSHIAAYFSAADSRKITTGARAQVVLMPNETNVVKTSGNVSAVLRNADPKTGQSIVTVRVPNQNLPVRSYAFVRIALSQRTALALPTTAIIIDQGRTYVYKAESNGDYDKILVEIGNQEPDFTEIKGGITASDVVLVEGALAGARKGLTGTSGKEDE